MEPGRLVSGTRWLVGRLRAGCPEQGAEVAAQVRELLAEDGFEGKCLIDAVTVLSELMTNAIEHGCAGQPDATVDVEAFLTRTHVGFRVRNPGPGFHVEAALQRSQATLTSGDSLRGRGLALVRLLAKRMAHRDQGRLFEAIVMKACGKMEDQPVEMRFVEGPRAKGVILKPGDLFNMWGLPSVKNHAEHCLDFGVRYFFIDLADVLGIDSSGLGFLCWLRRECVQRGGCVALFHMNDSVRQVLPFVFSNGGFEIFPTFEAAKEALQAKVA